MSAWLHTEITDHGPQEYVVTITADRNLSGKERKAEAVIRVNDELRELITVHQEYRKDSLATNESVFECLPEVTQMTIEYSSTLPIDSLILLCEAPYVKATLAENRIELSLDLNISLEDRSFDAVLTTADEYVNTLKWTINQRATVRNADGMVQFDDAAFKKAVLEMHDTDGDGDLSIEEAEAIEHLDVSGKDIRNLNGVEPMRNLRSLDFRNNPKLYKIINNNGADIIYNQDASAFIDLSDPHPFLIDIYLPGGIKIDITGCPSYVWMRGDDATSKGTEKKPIFYDYAITQRTDQYIGYMIDKLSYNCTYAKRIFTETDTAKTQDWSQAGKEIYIQKHTKGPGIPITLTIKGFIDKDIESDSDDRLAKIAFEHMFAHDPMKSYRDYFDCIYVIFISQERMDNTSELTKFHNSFITERYPRIEFINAGNEGNNAYYYMGKAYLASKAIMDFSGGGYEINHECIGHWFGHLHDEYCEGKETWPEGKVLGNYLNVSTTNDPEKVPWSRFLKHPNYKDKIGIYEGGATKYRYGIWRSSKVGCMMSNSAEAGFNTIGRFSIFRRIMFQSGEWKEAFNNEENSENLRIFYDWYYGGGSNGIDRQIYETQLKDRMAPIMEDWLFETFIEYDKINHSLKY